MIRFEEGGLTISDSRRRPRPAGSDPEPHNSLTASIDGHPASLFLPDVQRLYEALGEYLAERGVKA